MIHKTPLLYVVACFSLIILTGCTATTAASPAPTSTQAVAAGATTFSTVSENTQTPEPTELPPIEPQRVVLISVDGGSAPFVQGMIEDGVMPHMAGLQAQGVWHSLDIVEPPTSIVAHHSLACGCDPAQTGIVGDRVHRSEDSFYWYTSSYTLAALEGIPLWQAATEGGLPAAVLFWPGTSIENTASQADYFIGYGKQQAYSKLHELFFYGTTDWQNAPEVDTPLLESQFVIEGADANLATVFVLALDQEPADGVYDTFIFSNGDRIVDEADAVLANDASADGAWGWWPFNPDDGLGADFLIVNSDLEQFQLYQSGVYDLPAAPDALRAALLDQFHYFPPAPDFYALDHGWITVEYFMDMVNRQVQWITDVTLWVNETYQPDLLLVTQSALKQAGHQFMLVDEQQLVNAAQMIDENIERMYSALEPELQSGNLTVILTGTSGMAPVHTRVTINTVLEQAGLLTLDGRNYVRVSASQALAFSSGGAAHIYINLAGREHYGIVSEEEYAQVQQQIIEAFKALNDPASGEPVFARVVTAEDAQLLGMGGPYMGDVFIQANPGYYLSDWRGSDLIFDAPGLSGEQGFPATTPDMQGYVVLSGVSMHNKGVQEPASLLEIAPTITMLLGLEPANTMQGTPLSTVHYP